MTGTSPSKGESAVPTTPWVDLGTLPETAAQESLPEPTLPVAKSGPFFDDPDTDDDVVPTAPIAPATPPDVPVATTPPDADMWVYDADTFVPRRVTFAEDQPLAGEARRGLSDERDADPERSFPRSLTSANVPPALDALRRHGLQCDYDGTQVRNQLCTNCGSIDCLIPSFSALAIKRRNSL